MVSKRKKRRKREEKQRKPKESKFLKASGKETHETSFKNSMKETSQKY